MPAAAVLAAGGVHGRLHTPAATVDCPGTAIANAAPPILLPPPALPLPSPPMLLPPLRC